ncbi:MAG: DNA repair protein RadC [Erysipelotrichaceae bacterium]|nr:DNA repair protein RadC [Erysipelotrichaceae bacterium]
MMKIKEIQNNERPREKLRNLGIRSLNDAELLAILLRSGIAGKSAIQLAKELLSLCGSINNLSALDVNTLESIKGIKGVKASEVLALCEVSRRMAQQASLEVDVIDQPSRLVNWLKKELGSSQQEQFMVVFLNTKNHIIGYKILYMGGLDRSIVHPREVYKEALKVSAARIIAVHNHPSGDVSPSENDRLVTKVLEEAGDTMGIPLLDHLIVSHYGYTSLRQILKKD